MALPAFASARAVSTKPFGLDLMAERLKALSAAEGLRRGRLLLQKRQVRFEMVLFHSFDRNEMKAGRIEGVADSARRLRVVRHETPVPNFEPIALTSIFAPDLTALSGRVITNAMKKTLLHGLFPVVRAEVLRLLFTNPRQELYVRELARLSFLSLQTVQDELAKLEISGLISSRSNGYHRFYRANPGHPLFMPRCAGWGSRALCILNARLPPEEVEASDAERLRWLPMADACQPGFHK